MTRHLNGSMHQKSSPAAAALIHSCVLSAEVVLKLVKPFAHTNKPPESSKAERNLITALISTFPLITCHSCRTGEASVEAALTMKVLVVLLGLITATFLSGKGADREEGRELGQGLIVGYHPQNSQEYQLLQRLH